MTLLLLLACHPGPSPTGGSDDSGCTPTSWVADEDGDGFGQGVAVLACQAPAGHVSSDGDCDDADAAVNPAAAEACDGRDNDCDGAVDPAGTPGDLTCYRDADEDGFGTPAMHTTACTCPDGYGTDATDCDDADAAIHPGGTETWYDGIDQDCDPDTEDDADLDGFGWDGVGGLDCDDADALVHPDAEEQCGNGVDDDCDGLPPDCGLDSVLGSGGADGEVRTEVEAHSFLWLSLGGDANGDGLPEVMTSSKRFRTESTEPLQHVLFEPGVAVDRVVGLLDDPVAVLNTPGEFADLDLNCFSDGPCGVVDIDLDGDGYGDAIVASMPSVEHAFDVEALSLVSLAYGPLVGEIELDASNTIATAGLEYHLGNGVAWLSGSGRNGEGALAMARVFNGLVGDEPALRLVEPAHLLGVEALQDAIAVDVVPAAYASGQDVQAGDIDGDGVDDLTWSRFHHDEGDPARLAEVVVLLGPITSDVDAGDADHLVSLTDLYEDWEGSGGWIRHALLPAGEGSESGTGGLAVVTGFAESFAVTLAEESVWLFQWTGPGTVTPDRAAARLSADGDLQLGGQARPTWGGDVDADGLVELVVPFNGSFPAVGGGDDIGGAFIVEPPASGVADLLDAEHIIRHEEGEDLGIYATLSGRSWDGDPYQDLLLGQFLWNPDDPSDDGDFGRALLFQGGPEGY